MEYNQEYKVLPQANNSFQSINNEKRKFGLEPIKTPLSPIKGVGINLGDTKVQRFKEFSQILSATNKKAKENHNRHNSALGTINTKPE